MYYSYKERNILFKKSTKKLHMNITGIKLTIAVRFITVK